MEAVTAKKVTRLWENIMLSLRRIYADYKIKQSNSPTTLEEERHFLWTLNFETDLSVPFSTVFLGHY